MHGRICSCRPLTIIFWHGWGLYLLRGEIYMNQLIELGLVTKNERALVSSRMIADKFGKRHDNLINKIESTIDNWNKDTALKNKVSKYFFSHLYKDTSGKSNKEYLLSRDGFSYIVMSFTGREADIWKVKYIEAFNAMENFIRERQTAEWQQSRLTGKQIRREVSDIILAKLIPLAETQGSKNAGKLYMAYSKLVNATLGIEAGQRDKLPLPYIDAIKFLENAIENIISIEVDKGTHYKSIYYVCKAKCQVIKELAFLPSIKLIGA